MLRLSDILKYQLYILMQHNALYLHLYVLSNHV